MRRVSRDVRVVRAFRPVATVVLAALAVSLCASTTRAATLFDPLLKFRVLSTPHFRIYFHQGGDRLAAQLATIAESTWRALEQPLGVRPPALTHVVLADQTDLSNGYATPLPYDTIVIYTVWPPGAEFDVDDWLRLVFTHEFTHIVHLDRSRGWAHAVRAVFGRTPIAFPNLFLPTWQIEGLATYVESAITGEGRLHAGEFRAITDEAARHRALEPLDRVNGGLTDWPSGQAAYAYGLAFHQYLADRFGIETLGALGDATAGRVPYIASEAFKRVYGKSLGELWRDFERETADKAGSPAMDAEVTRLTHDGFVVAGPRIDPTRCAGCPATMFYVKRTPDAFPSLVRMNVDGSAPATIATRYLGSTTAPGRDEIFFDQMEVRRNVGLYGDLYAWSRTTGRVRQMTSEARVHDPDLSPDGAALVCTQDHLGARDLVLVRLKSFTTSERVGGATGADVVSGSGRTQRATRTNTATIDVLVAEADTQFNAPRWSADGRQIAVERHRLGSDPEIVVVDVATRSVHVVAHVAKTRFVMPVWRPDGRAIVAAVAADDHVFNLFEVPLDGSPMRQLTHTSGGATWPEISPDGRTLFFVGYTVSGSDIYALPYPPAAPPSGSDRGRTEVRPQDVQLRSTLRNGVDIEDVEQADTTSCCGEVGPRSDPGPTPYSPLPTLKPTSWSPVVDWVSDQIRVGAETAGRDVLGYHSYTASATWLAVPLTDAPTPDASVPDWFVSYVYDRWRPTLFAAASRTTSFFAGPATDAGTPSAATRRERVVEGGVVLPFVHTRVSHGALAELFRAVDDYTLTSGDFTRARTAVRAAWQTRTARTYGYSISPEDGVLVGGTIEVVDRALGASADATTMTVDARAFLPGLGRHHILAARVAGGRSTGDPVVGRTFVLGGPGSDASVIDFGSGAASLLRGFAANSFAGSHVALMNVEYRWPIAQPQRGVGTWPFFLHTIHAAAFVDAGHAWTRVYDAAAFKTSAGAELSANVVAGFYFPFTATGGIAWRRDGSGTIPTGVALYFRVGKSF